MFEVWVKRRDLVDRINTVVNSVTAVLVNKHRVLGIDSDRQRKAAQASIEQKIMELHQQYYNKIQISHLQGKQYLCFIWLLVQILNLIMRIIGQTGKRIEEYFFNYSSNIDIHRSITPHISNNCLLNIRRIACVLLTIVLIMIQRVDSSFLGDLMFLSEQGFILSWLYFLLVLQHHHISNAGYHQAASRIGKTAQVLFQIALCFEVPITIIEWSLLFEDELQTETTEQIIVEILQHSTPIIFLLIDLFANPCRFERRRLILIVGYGIAYLAINLGHHHMAGFRVLYLRYHSDTLDYWNASRSKIHLHEIQNAPGRPRNGSFSASEIKRRLFSL